MRFIDERSIERIGFNRLLSRVEILSNYGEEKLKNLKPFVPGEEEALERNFEEIQQFINFSEETDRKSFLLTLESCIHRMKNIKKLIRMVENGNVLDEVELFEVKVQAIYMEKLQECLQELPAELQGFSLQPLNKILEALDPQSDRNPTFYLYESYSRQLTALREQRKKVEKQIYATRDYDTIVKLKEERLTFLVEEEKEEYRIRTKLSQVIAEEANIYLENIEKIGNLDFLIAKAKFAKKYSAHKPGISRDSFFQIKKAVNLELKEMLEAKGKTYTPIGIELGEGVTIITGANMGGKSVALKTITENLLLFHMGFFVIAEEASLPLVDFVFFISDDMQDISKGLSTFGAEIMKLQEVNVFLELGKGFVVFDEFARGTNPKEGQKFVRALAKFLNGKPSISLITTHFDGVVDSSMNHYQVVGLKNIDFELLKNRIALSNKSMELIQECMDFRLERASVEEVPKDALNIAKLIGLDEKFNEVISQEYHKED
ncbi:hypothetical protein C4N15_05695 [Fusobacterium necrophorum subsp. funduliforme]|uniref:lysine 5,6-aminomutase reactivase ATPase KamC n=1 Tax=Fusobacterium necrophorum TaxID=859 RepID=UPI000D13A101|nr:hypothetical protein [Fusobacterium necrophorum]AVQ21158.1 hypothetical protein C4N15_05695 [Fusobacterium necrophorum subsp. funduliforme]